MISPNPLMITGRHIALPLVNEPEALVTVNSITELLAMIFHHLFKGENIEKSSFLTKNIINGKNIQISVY